MSRLEVHYWMWLHRVRIWWGSVQ